MQESCKFRIQCMIHTIVMIVSHLMTMITMQGECIRSCKPDLPSLWLLCYKRCDKKRHSVSYCLVVFINILILMLILNGFESSLNADIAASLLGSVVTFAVYCLVCFLESRPQLFLPAQLMLNNRVLVFCASVSTRRRSESETMTGAVMFVYSKLSTLCTHHMLTAVVKGSSSS